MENDRDVDSAAVLHRFLRRYLADVEGGHELGLDDYLRLFPGYEEAVARKFEELQSGTPRPGESPTKSVPERIGRFEVIRELGSGGQAVVYLAEDPKLGRRVALKVLGALRGQWEDARERLLREAEVLSRLDHPAICTVYEIGEADDRLYLAMRYVEGETVATLLAHEKRGAQDPRPAAAVERHRILRWVARLEQAARAIHAAHRAGVVHRDLKPGNLLETPEGAVAILDFGLARSLGTAALTLTGDQLGTPAYMSPEQIRGQWRQVDRRTDVYSLAVTLYECLALRRPFEAPTRHGLYRAIVAGVLPDLRRLAPEVPHDLKMVVETGLARDPNDRYESALELAEELARVKRGEPVRARRPRLPLRTLRWCQSNPLVTSLAAAFVALLAVSVGIVGAQLRRTTAQHEDNRRLADTHALPFLHRIAREELWPALPERQAALASWLDEAEALLARAPQHRAALRRVQSGKAHPDRAVGIQRARLAQYVAALSSFETLVANVRWRFQVASTVEERSLERPREDWARTIARVRDSPQYGFELTLQRGLVPLGPDPDSGLEEFAHLLSGEPPRRDAQSGRLVIEEDSGIVLVLIPGGAFRMGAVRPDDKQPLGSPNVDPLPNPGQSDPVHLLQIDPYFLSKYEMTQGQWQRITGEIPSFFRPGQKHRGFDTGTTLQSPVDTVHWIECDRVLRQVELTLPTEAQWEHACRGDRATPLYTIPGVDVVELQGFENIADEASADQVPEYVRCQPGFADGFAFTAPVGSFSPNPFGLHDMLGNVLEWCRDRYGRYEQETAPGDAERIVAHAEAPRVLRGASMYDDRARISAFLRFSYHPRGLDHRIGVRPGRPVRVPGRGPGPARSDG